MNKPTEEECLWRGDSRAEHAGSRVEDGLLLDDRDLSI